MQAVYNLQQARMARNSSSVRLLGNWQINANLWYTMFLPTTASPSSSGLGHRPFKAVTRVRVPLGAPLISQPPAGGFFVPAEAMSRDSNPVGGGIGETATLGWLLSCASGARARARTKTSPESSGPALPERIQTKTLPESSGLALPERIQTKTPPESSGPATHVPLRTCPMSCFVPVNLVADANGRYERDTPFRIGSCRVCLSGRGGELDEGVCRHLRRVLRSRRDAV